MALKVASLAEGFEADLADVGFIVVVYPRVNLENILV